jgi:hypothetical protein
MPRKHPRTLTLITRSQSAMVAVSMGPRLRIPALLTSTRTGPNADTAVSTAAAHPASEVTSRCT